MKPLTTNPLWCIMLDDARRAAVLARRDEASARTQGRYALSEEFRRLAESAERQVRSMEIRQRSQIPTGDESR